MVSLEYESSSGETINLRVTPEHPFLTVSGAFSGRGDEGGWVEAGSLKAGDTIFDMDGGLPARVKSVRFENISEKVYNFEVEGNHNYFVSEDGILSHNGKRGIGPSGKPKLHFCRCGSRKKAKDAARNAPGSSGVASHMSPQRGGSHFHSTDPCGKIIKDGIHYVFGKK